MNVIKLTALFLLLNFYAYSQSGFNLGFEQLDDDGNPVGWDITFKYGGAKGYINKIDNKTVKNGKNAFSLKYNADAEEQTFGACAFAIPAKYEGRVIKLRGFLKTENVSVDGYAGLWMRLDGSGEFYNMEDQKITGTNDWKEYTIELPLTDAVTTIHVGGLIVGKGKIWIDDFEVFIDDKPIEEAPEKKVTIYPASLDSAFYTGSGITIEKINAQQKEDLVLLGKIWGFAKYHHPQVALGNHNMDFELFRILPQVLNAKNSKDRDKAILNWLDKLGDIPTCSNCQPCSSKEEKWNPDLKWMNDETISKKLRKKLQFILDNRNQGDHYYIGMVPNVGNPEFKNENAYADLDYPDAGFRILALYKYWNIIHYFFPYKYMIEKDWNEVLVEFMPNFIEAKDALAYRLEVLKLIENIHDTHANIWTYDKHLNDHWGNLHPAFQVKFIEEQLVVTDYYHDEYGKQSKLIPGDVILEIDGTPADQLKKDLIPYHPASNYPTKLRDIAKTILRSNEKEANLKVLRDGKQETFTVKRYERKELDVSIDWAYNQPDSCFSLIDDKIGYLYIGNIKNDLLPEAFEKFKDTKGLIIDIRNYPSDFVVFSLGAYLHKQPTPFVKFTSGDVNCPGLFEVSADLKVGNSNPDHYKGKVVILINEISQSSAEYHTMALRATPNVTVIGSTTAGADGNISFFTLPGDMRTAISGIGVYYPDGTQTQRIGIVPDIELKPTIKGVKAGKDELLDKAIEVILKENR